MRKTAASECLPQCVCASANANARVCLCERALSAIRQCTVICDYGLFEHNCSLDVSRNSVSLSCLPLPNDLRIHTDTTHSRNAHVKCKTVAN